MDQTFTISGMHCGACVKRVSDALQPFAERVAVTLDPPQAVLTGARASDVSELAAAVARAGTYTLAAERQAADGTATAHGERSWLGTYYPLVLIAAYIAAASFAGTDTAGRVDMTAWMTNFMAGFFLVFSAFKFLDLRGFADAYATYDLLARRLHAYGFVYPVLELALGLAYLFRFAPAVTQTATIVLMGFSSLGVIGALRQKRTIQCACLGTVLKLPMSTITLVEDLGMVAMAAIALIAGHN